MRFRSEATADPEVGLGGAGAAPSPEAAAYDRAFFEGLTSSASAEAVASVLAEIATPMSVLDLGCGTGSWLAAFRALGVADVLGVDGAYVQADLLEIPAADFLPHDLATPLEIGRRFDLVLSVEVGEHLPASAASAFVQTIARHGDLVAFGAALPGQGGCRHINEQWPDYWVALFQREGFELFDVLRPLLWEDARVLWWYRQNLLLFARGEAAARFRAWAEGRPNFGGLPIVHPELFAGRTPRALGVREHLRQLPDATTAALRRRARSVVGRRRRLAGSAAAEWD